MTTVQIASIPDREESLRQTVNSLRSQVDRIFVGLNNYGHVPDFLNNGEWVMLDNSTGDAAKFYNVEFLHGYIFTCDDDLVYPPGYIDYMISKIEQHKSIVSLHGKIFFRPVREFWDCVPYPCLRELKHDIKVDIGGTGVMAWHSDFLKVKYSDFKCLNMADVWMGKIAHDQNIDIMCVAHEKDYLTYIPPKTTLWRTESEKRFKVQIEILKSFLK